MRNQVSRWTGRSRRGALTATGAIAVTVSLVAGACSFVPAPEGDPPYQQTDFNLCERVDLGPLDPWSPTVWEEAPDTTLDFNSDELTRVPAPGSCVFGMRTADGRHAALEIRTYVEDSVEDATTSFERRRERPADSPGDTAMESAGALDGVGEQAVGFTRTHRDPLYARGSRPESYQRYPEYRVLARTKNLIVEVHLGMGDDVSPERLAGPAQAIASQALADFPPAPAPSPAPPRGKAYHIAEVELCEEIDTGSVESQLPVRRDESYPADGDDDSHAHLAGGSECHILLASDDPELRHASLRVRIFERHSIVNAEDKYDWELDWASRPTRRPREADPDVAPIGERTDALTRMDEIEDTDIIDNDYLLLALDGNLVVYLELSVSAYVEISSDVLRDGVHPIARDVLAAVPLVADA